jgi:hypothetical protein
MSGIAALLVLTVAAQGPLQGTWFRVLTGGTAGGLTQWYLRGVTPAVSYLEACAQGDLGVAGFLFLVALVLLFLVWAYNLNQTGGALVR